MIWKLSVELHGVASAVAVCKYVAVHTRHCPRASAGKQRPTHRLKATTEQAGWKPWETTTAARKEMDSKRIRQPLTTPSFTHTTTQGI